MFIAPWKRRTWKERCRRLRQEFYATNKREAARLRSLGASEHAIWHSCYRVGSPKDTRWIRFKAWFCGDFFRLQMLNDARELPKA